MGYLSVVGIVSPLPSTAESVKGFSLGVERALLSTTVLAFPGFSELGGPPTKGAVRAKVERERMPEKTLGLTADVTSLQEAFLAHFTVLTVFATIWMISSCVTIRLTVSHQDAAPRSGAVSVHRFILRT